MDINTGIAALQVADAAQATTAAAAPALPPHAADAINVLSMASSAISTVLSTAQFALAGFGLILALLGVVGYHFLEKRLVRRALKRVQKIAEEKLDAYLEGEHFKNVVDGAVESSVQKRFANAIIVQQAAPQPAVADPVPREMAR